MPSRRRVLIVENAAESNRELAYLLEAKGYQIVSSPSIRQAADTIFNDPPDMVFIIPDITDKIDLQMLQAFKTSIHCTHIPFILALPEKILLSGLEWKDYPVDDFVVKPVNHEELHMRMTLCFARMQRVFDNNPLTRLPGNTSIVRAIQAAVDSGNEAAIGYVDIDNFKPYNDRYGFSRGDEVIRMVAMLLTNALREVDSDRVFAGHVGGDDFTFLVPVAAAGPVSERILGDFAMLIRNFVDKDDLARGYFPAKDRQGNAQYFPIPSLSIAVVINEGKRFSHYGAVAETASQIKKQLKSMDGNNYFIDRRKSAE